ncbi:hypothetical protein PQI66_13325 [Corynebacterium sp. USCH3]|uniref:hypothetical protein n=1 Tax=Corynebacterium sp. USCH3 TaxID=3024840 RepID=UPI0030ADE2C0
MMFKRRKFAVAVALTVSASAIPAAVGQPDSHLEVPQSPSSNEIQVVEPGESFEIPLDAPSSEGISPQLGVGSCAGTIDGPKLKKNERIYYGINVSCSGSGFLPLRAKATLQEQHLGAIYQNVADTGVVPLTGGGYGYAGSDVGCGTSTGHNYRVSAEIWAGDHYGSARSQNIFLKCNV